MNYLGGETMQWECAPGGKWRAGRFRLGGGRVRCAPGNAVLHLFLSPGMWHVLFCPHPQLCSHRGRECLSCAPPLSGVWLCLAKGRGEGSCFLLNLLFSPHPSFFLLVPIF